MTEGGPRGRIVRNAATLYTLYGRRAGAELCFEKTLASMAEQSPDIRWTVLCNRESMPVVEGMGLPGLEAVYVPDLDNQFRKAFWLEFRSAAFFRSRPQDVFWNPSGCNHFPGKWPFPTVTTFLDLGEYHVREKYDWKRMFFRKAVCIPRSARRSAAFTAISRFTAEDAERILRLVHVRPVLLGPSPHVLAPVPEAKAILAKALGGKVPDRFWFVPGRTDFVGKGLDLVLEAAAHDRARDAVLFSGPEGVAHGAFLERMAQIDGEGGRLRYLGRVSEEVLSALYRECFAVVLPSRFEGFGFPVLEAMDAGAPVVCSDAGSLPEVAGNAALLFPSGDASALAACMARLRDEPGLRERLQERGRERGRHFSWEVCGREMLDVLRSAAADGKRRG